MVIAVTLIAIVVMLAGMGVMSGARQHSPREFIGACMVLGAVLAIPVAAALSVA